MRLLKFNTTGQKLSKDPACDFSGLQKGSSGYLKAEFNFDSEWSGTVKVAEFSTRTNGNEEQYPALIKNGICEIPPEATAKRRFSVRVVGKHGNMLLRTNKLLIIQEG